MDPIVTSQVSKQEMITDYLKGAKLPHGAKVLFRRESSELLLQDGDGVIRGKIYVNLNKGECQETVNGFDTSRDLEGMAMDLELMQRFVQVGLGLQYTFKVCQARGWT